MSESEIFDKVADIVAEQLCIDKSELTRETSFAGDLNADSLDMVEVILKLEEVFEMEIPDADAHAIKTMGEAVKYIQQHISAEAA